MGFCSDMMETCSNVKFNTKLFDPEVLVQYNPDIHNMHYVVLNANQLLVFYYSCLLTMNG